MRKTSIRDLHIRTSELVREAAEGQVIVIESRGKAVAELRPLSGGSEGTKVPDLSEVWARMPKVSGDSGRFLEEDR
jgi:prevent-host-death family protein